MRRTLRFSGDVQGVGFRATAAALARRHRLSGFVRNLADGRVETVVEGDDPAVERFLADLRQTFERHIRDCEDSRGVGTGEFEGFEIVY
jgi:acylphosphatase